MIGTKWSRVALVGIQRDPCYTATTWRRHIQRVLWSLGTREILCFSQRVRWSLFWNYDCFFAKASLDCSSINKQTLLFGSMVLRWASHYLDPASQERAYLLSTMFESDILVLTLNSVWPVWILAWPTFWLRCGGGSTFGAAIEPGAALPEAANVSPVL